MRLPRPRDLGNQQVLWDWVDDAHLDNVLTTRTYLGDFFEELLVQLYKGIGAQRLTTDARADICPDISHDQGWIEVKSLGRGSNVIVYEHSMQRYEALHAAHPDKKIHFALCRHKFQFKFASRLSEMHEKLGNSIESVALVPFDEVLKATSAIEPQPLRIRSEGEHQFVNAWRLPKAVTDQWYAGQQRLVCDVEVYGARVQPLTVIDGTLL